MEACVLTSLCVLFNLLLLLLLTVISKGQSEHASLPPRGWNSYDSFCWTISEEEFLHNAELVAQRLKANGYEYVVVDYLWYRRKVEGAYTDSLGFDVIDEWGRMIPDPGRWTSSKDGKGFTEVAKKVHSMGLKFGIHVMRGISTQAVNANTPILDITKGRAYEESGRRWYAKDIGLKERACAWMSHGFMSVNTKLGAGRAFLRSLYQQYADWGVDFVKHDCIFGDDLDLDEIAIVSEVLRGLNRPILYSLSPGTSVTPAMAKDVHGLVNMYRITGDDWDKWKDVASHFDIARDFGTANMMGAQGLLGKSWPDLDMLPLGWLTNEGSNEGPHRRCSLTLDEQKTQMTLWSMAKSPLMFGGDMRKLDETTFNLITHPTLLEINSFSSNNMEFPHVTSINGLRFGERGLSWESRSLADNDSPGHNFSLSNCMDPKAKGWSSEAIDNDLQKICWKGSTRSRYEEPFCLYKRGTLLASDEEMMYEHQYQGKFHLLAADTMDFCFSGSPKRKLTSKEFRRGSFSPCKWDTNQMWELRHDGSLKNSYSGLCVSVNTVKVNADSGGIRSWIATGRRGEIYVAFFNLNAQGTVISAKISDLAEALPGRNLNNGKDSCSAKEVWSGKDLGEVKETLSTPVQMHGCALFVLTCH
ncbi:alpha-galactosidase mel1 [Diospyros lotus]|uniref:alpha-galactosidase mel1 n=1 Tax=Diospyros lotus TaxID=55363 RepID=UPI00224EBB62|nr:alpha-galactosidase mel1 [Diospyros lotus]